MTIIQALILGLVQGLGEFLPISSSAHLILVPWFFGWKDPGLGFDLALHWGTLLAVFIYFRTDIVNIIRGFLHSLKKTTRDFEGNIYQKLSWYLLIATIPGTVIGKLLEEKVETVFRNPLLIAATLSLAGILLWLVDSASKKEKNLNRITWKDSLIIGLSQATAIIPGISRSGATMISALGLKFKREDAARFSFLLSIPIILGAGLSKIKEISSASGSPELIVGFFASAVSGFFAIKYLLKYISKKDFRVFVWYRIALAVIILLVYYVRQ